MLGSGVLYLFMKFWIVWVPLLGGLMVCALHDYVLAPRLSKPATR